MRGHGRDAEARADVKACAGRKSHDPVRRQVRIFLRRACGPLVAREKHPDPIPGCQLRYPLAHCVDDTGTVLVRSHLRERRGGAVAGAQARLPIGGVDTRDSDADSDLTGLRVRYIPIDESENRWVTSARVDDRPHGLDNPSASSIIPDSIGPAPDEVHTSTTCGHRGLVCLPATQIHLLGAVLTDCWFVVGPSARAGWPGNCAAGAPSGPAMT